MILALSIIVFRIRLSYKKPNIIAHHVFIPESLVASLHGFHLLVKTFTVFVTDIAKVRGEKIQVGIQEVHLQ